MPTLKSPKREAFAQAVARSAKTGKSLTDCYRDSGYRGEGHVAEVGASRLMTYDEVRGRIAEILRPVTTKTRVTVESLLRELEQTIGEARADGQHSVVISALALSGKLAGLLKERIEIGGAPGGFQDCDRIEEVAGRLLDDGPLDDALRVRGQLRAALIRVASDRALAVS